jgi:hypothetical protein
MNSLAVRALALVTTFAVATAACNKQSSVEKLRPDTEAVTALDVNPDGQILRKLFQSAGPKTQFFTIQNRERITISTQGGNKYTFPALALRRKDGTIPTGPISVAIREVNSPRDFVLADKPTAAAGNYLISYGEYFIRATEAGADLVLAAPVAVQTVVKDQTRPPGQIPMWDGDTTINVTTTGWNQLNQPTSVTTPVTYGTGVNWVAAPDVATYNPSTNTVDFQIANLVTWRNCDAFNGLPGPKTTVLGYFNIYNDGTSSSAPDQPSLLFFKPTNINSIVKFSTQILNAPAGFKGFLSYQAVIPIGQQGTFLAITVLNGQYYAELKPVTIPAPAGGNNYVPVSFNLQPVTAAQVITLVTNLNSL